MRTYIIYILLTAGILHASEPTVDSVDYSAPAGYLEIAASLGNREYIISQAQELKGSSDIATIRNILSWMDRNLKYDPDIAYSWRNFDDVIKEKTYGGCADQGIVCGVLLKGADIPVVWVKTMDVSWIWDFKKGRKFESWSGHVFLEVYVEGKWMLLNPGAKMIYREYTPKMRILPGNRFAYHKGNDPKEMIMSLQWEQWKEQTSTYFRDMDESLLPVDSAGGTSISPQAYVVGNSPYYQVITQMAKERGLTVPISFNTKYDEYLPQARGNFLLIETHSGVPIVPVNVLEKYFPDASEGLKNPDGIVKIGETTIVFLDFSKQLSKIQIDDNAKKK
ncbi:MAG: transglutaminase domain-containing protein [Sedimentisphaerales bacterium]|nr:transglutaminase domain-containing protein [Sedimentisphaerales bacterium]